MQKLSVRGVSKSYGDVVALKPTTLELPAGEFLTLLGPSGSGKTTLLMILAGLIPPDAGEVLIDGKVATHAPPHLRDIGLVFQNYALFPHLSVFENIAFPLRMRGKSEAEIRRSVERILDVIRLPHVADRLPSELSGGQQQRVAVGRCAVYEPSIVLMDEPLGALDKKLRDQMQREIKRIHRELAVTVLYVTHDQEEAMALSDRICLMNEGRIEQIGTPAELYFRPVSRFAADFLGGANLINATVVGRDQSSIVVEGPAATKLSVPRVGDAAFDLGERVLVMIRPEHLDFSTGEDERSFEVELREQMMIGPLTRFYGVFADGTPIVVTRLTRERAAKACPLKASLRWSPEHVVLLKSGGER